MIIRKALRKPTAADTVYLIKANNELKQLNLTDEEVDFIKKAHRSKENVIELNRYKNRFFFVYGDNSGSRAKRHENFRKLGNDTTKMVNKAGISRVVVYPLSATIEETTCFAEGMVLGNYQFLKYFKEADKKKNSLEQVDIYADEITDDHVNKLQILTDGVSWTRNMVNEPVNYLTATQFAEEMKETVTGAGALVEVFNRKKIETLKMGGLLAVNKGSQDPPTFTIMEWKPEKRVNSKPYVFVGKGVVYDTGGLSLKPTNAMDTMKCDMAGGAAVAGAIYAIASAKLPVHVIGLVPATDNRPDGNAYVPGDVIKMYDGSTVEVLNTDAEGRMILADALSYARKYDPELVINIATLTGSAARAIGPLGMVGMNVGADQEFQLLQRSGEQVNERIVEFPM